MPNRVITSEIFSGAIEIRRWIRVTGENKLGKAKAPRVPGVMFDRAVKCATPGFASLELVDQAIREASGLELKALDGQPIAKPVKDNEVAALRPRLGVIVEEMEERV